VPAIADPSVVNRDALVMIADLIIIGVHSGCTDLITAAMPAMWGEAILVPLRYSTFPPTTAARMSTPGARMSGFSSDP